MKNVVLLTGGLLAFSMIPVQATDLTIKSGQTIGLLNNSAFTSDDCKPMRGAVKIVKAPQHGKLWTKSGVLDPRDANSGHGWFSNRCNGRYMPSTIYYYRPNPGFRGEDVVHLRTMIGGDKNFRYRITVK